MIGGVDLLIALLLVLVPLVVAVGWILGTSGADAGPMVDVSIRALATLSRQITKLRIKTRDVTLSLSLDSALALALALASFSPPIRRDEMSLPFSLSFKGAR